MLPANIYPLPAYAHGGRSSYSHGPFYQAGGLAAMPVVFGALFFGNSLFPVIHNELWLKILVLALLFLFLVMGSGPLSLSHLLNIKMKESEKAPVN